MTRKEKFLEDLDLTIKTNEELAREFVINGLTRSIGIGVKVYITSPDLPDYEVISNGYKNLPIKRAYYEKAYDDDLRLKANPDIGIANWGME